MANNIRYADFADKFEVIHRNEKDQYAMPPHTHNAIEIYLNLSDIQSALLGANITPLKPNTLLIIPSYCIHQFMRRENDIYDRYILTINTAWISSVSENEKRSLLNDRTHPYIIALSDEQRDQLTGLFEDCMDCDELRYYKRLSCFFAVMDYISELLSGSGAERSVEIKKHLSGTRKTVSQMIEYINEHLYENIRIQDIAEAFFLSPDYAAKIFKKHTNTPIGNYITIQRMTKARQLLRSGSTVTETQLKTGYSSYEHFFRTFKKSVGITPKEYSVRHAPK